MYLLEHAITHCATPTHAFLYNEYTWSLSIGTPAPYSQEPRQLYHPFVKPPHLTHVTSQHATSLPRSVGLKHSFLSVVMRPVLTSLLNKANTAFLTNLSETVIDARITSYVVEFHLTIYTM